MAGINAEGAYQAAADTPLQALRKWIHYFGARFFAPWRQMVGASSVGVRGLSLTQMHEE